MKTKVRILLLVLATSLLFVGCQTKESPGQASASPDPQICCGDETIDHSNAAIPGILSENFGTLEQGKMLVKKFTLKNSGKTTVKLVKEPVFSFPCCVTVELDKTIVQPGEHAEVVVTFDSSLRPGPIDIFVDLPFDGEDIPKKLHLGGMVRSEFVVRPTGLKFEKPESIEFTVSGEGLFKEFQITGIENSFSQLKVKELSRTEDEIVYQATWTGQSQGGAIAPIFLNSDHPRVKEFPILIAPPGVATD